MSKNSVTLTYLSTFKVSNTKRKITSSNAMDLLNIEKMTKVLEQRNVNENFELAMETAPESFGSVVMLWINVKVNGHHFKGKFQKQ